MISITKREKTLLQIFVFFLAGLGLYFLLIKPFLEQQKNIELSSNTNLVKLNQLEKIYKSYREVKHEKENLEKLLKNSGGITSLIEEMARKTNILDKKAYSRDHPTNIKNKYKKITTDIKFESVPIESIVRFIYELEQSDKIIKIGYLKINEAIRDKKTYDITLKIETYTLN